MEMAMMGGDSRTGLVQDYTVDETHARSMFKEIPLQSIDFHLGKMMFAHAQANYRSILLKQYRPETEDEKKYREYKRQVNVYQYSV